MRVRSASSLPGVVAAGHATVPAGPAPDPVTAPPADFPLQWQVALPAGPGTTSAAALRLGDSYHGRAARATNALGGTRLRAAEAVGFRLEGADVTSSELIRSFAHLDVSALGPAGVEAVAVFDFDNTLMRGDVLVTFMRLIIERDAFTEAGRAAVLIELRRAAPALWESLRALPAAAIVAAALDAFEAGDLTGKAFFTLAVRSLKGIQVTEAEVLASELFEEGGQHGGPYKHNGFDPSPDVGDSAREMVDVLRARGIRPVIVSAGVDFLARRGAAYFGVPAQDVYASAMVVGKDGTFTGEAPDIGDIGKDAIVRDHIGRPPLFVFGDSPRTDAKMMPLALVRAFMVNPSAAFIEQTRQHGRDHVIVRF